LHNFFLSITKLLWKKHNYVIVFNFYYGQILTYMYTILRILLSKFLTEENIINYIVVLYIILCYALFQAEYKYISNMIYSTLNIIYKSECICNTLY